MTNVSLLLCCTILSFGIVVNGSTYINGEEVGFYEIKTGNFSVKLTNWGASLASVVVPDKYGNLADVVLGYDSVEDYMNDTQYFGAIVGRVANRISGASFTLNGIVYQLDNNEKNKTLHGGKHGFNKVVWKVQNHVKDGPSPCITFSYYSPDGDQGFPGDLLVNVTYAVTGPYKLEVNMEAKALNKPTPVNLALHAYWNLGGQNSGDILSHKVKIFASHLTPTVRSIPTGQILPVKGTPYDFLQPHTITSVMNDNTLHALIINPLKELIPDNGYDVNYVLDGGVNKMKEAVVVCDEKSGRVVELWTSAPGMQFYTGNYVKNLKGKDDFVYGEHAGLALETQGFPDAVHHPNFPSQIVGPGEVYRHKMVYTFSTN